MIQGTIRDHRAVVSLRILGQDNSEAVVDFRIDTGFTGTMTLPPVACQRLNLRFRRTQAVRLAGEQQAQFDVYRGVLLWNGRERNLEILAAAGPPLLGMAALENSQVLLDVREGGTVTISTDGKTE